VHFRLYHTLSQDLLGVDLGHSDHLRVTLTLILIVHLFVTHFKLMDQPPIRNEPIFDDTVFVGGGERALEQP
jgi:hypothetical protein